MSSAANLLSALTDTTIWAYSAEHNIGLAKSGYQVYIFLISPQKQMLWVLIRSASSNDYPQHMFSWRNKKNINTFGLECLY